MLYSFTWSPPGELRSALAHPPQEGYGTIRTSPEEGHEDSQRDGGPLL